MQLPDLLSNLYFIPFYQFVTKCHCAAVIRYFLANKNWCSYPCIRFLCSNTLHRRAGRQLNFRLICQTELMLQKMHFRLATEVQETLS